MRLSALSLVLGCALWATSPLWGVPSDTNQAAPDAPASHNPAPHGRGASGPDTPKAAGHEATEAGRERTRGSSLADRAKPKVFALPAVTWPRYPESQLEVSSRRERTSSALVQERAAMHSARRAWPYFDRLESPRSAVSLGVTGVDPAAPRRLVLWRLGETPRRVATTWSERSGRFDFGQQLVPAAGVAYLVAADVAGEYQRIRPARLANAPAASRVSLRHGAGD